MPTTTYVPTGPSRPVQDLAPDTAVFVPCQVGTIDTTRPYRVADPAAGALEPLAEGPSLALPPAMRVLVAAEAG